MQNVKIIDDLHIGVPTPGLFPQKMGGSPHPFFKGKALGTRLIGVRARGTGGGLQPPSPPPNFGQGRFFGQQEKFGQIQFLKNFTNVFIISKR